MYGHFPFMSTALFQSGIATLLCEGDSYGVLDYKNATGFIHYPRNVEIMLDDGVLTSTADSLIAMGKMLPQEHLYQPLTLLAPIW